ncbi:MAG: biopolymer transporter ExbD [Deltaproteobacteria bacterium]|nr:biopolymer transporter ExbD [Deltaproteobacteria bacterium]
MKLCLETKRKARIEMLPLIDIVFLLLVFFIYAMLSMAVHHGLPIDLPISSSAEIDKKLVLSITVKSDGSVYLDKKFVALSDLTRRLKKEAEGHKGPGVLLFADRTLPYQKLFQVLDKIKMAGLEKISLQAERLKNQ